MTSHNGEQLEYTKHSTDVRERVQRSINEFNGRGRHLKEQKRLRLAKTLGHSLLVFIRILISFAEIT